MASVYTRIANPYMSNGTAASTNVASLYSPGELGCAFTDQSTGYSYLRVKLDSGATSATAVGAVAAGQLAFWKDRTNSIVTNDKRFADAAATTNGAVNRIAGIFANAVTAGYYTDVVINGKGVSVASDNSGTFGVQAIADTTVSVARVIGVASATTALVSQPVGVIVSTPSAGVALVDVVLGVIA